MLQVILSFLRINMQDTQCKLIIHNNQPIINNKIKMEMEILTQLLIHTLLKLLSMERCNNQLLRQVLHLILHRIMLIKLSKQAKNNFSNNRSKKKKQMNIFNHVFLLFLLINQVKYLRVKQDRISNRRILSMISLGFSS